MFWVMLMLSWCFCGVLAVFPWCCGGIEKIVFFGPILHTGAFTYRCTQKKLHVHAFTRRNSQHKLATRHRILTSVLDDGHAFHLGTVLPAQVQQKQIAISLRPFVINTRFVRGPFTAHRPNCNFTPVCSRSTRVSCEKSSLRTGSIAF